MTKTVITDKDNRVKNLLYIQNTLSEVFRQTGSVVSCRTEGGRAYLETESTPFYAGLIRDELTDKVADVLVVGYKYSFFKTKISPEGLNGTEKEILLAGIISADYDDDKRYVLSKLKDYDGVAIDGFYNFKLKLLKEKWGEIASYMPTSFLPEQLKDFILYLKNGKKNKVYIDGKNVYDSHYRRLLKTELIDYDDVSVTRETLLSSASEIELLSEIPESDEKYLKNYFGVNVRFNR
ncbi:MAG: hypothetical protein MJ072_00895 [Clostridia bacterium]|nr:hypothetical protein [Clostridia bacterium]